MRREWIRNALGAVLIGLALFATIGEGGNDDASNKSSNQSSQPASSQAAPIPIGTSATVAKGWDVKVNSSTLDFNAEAAAANQFNTPTDGTQYVAVNVSVTNSSGDPASPFTNVKLSLLPTSGVAISTAFVAGIAQQLDPSAQMQPGATATGVVVYEVPVADVASAVLLGEPLFTLDQTKDQKFFAIQ
jgi:hypothetical protein